MGHVVQGEFIAEKLFTHARVPGVRRVVLSPFNEQSGPADDHQQHEQNYELFPIHFAEVRFRLKTARQIPDIATSAGMPMMFPHFNLFSKASLSCASFLRSCFSSMLVCACFFLKFSSSACCSGERMKRWPLFSLLF